MAIQPTIEGLLGATDGLKRLHETMQLVHRDKQQIVIYAGDEVSKFYYLQSGYIKVYNITDDGDERTLMIRRPGDIFPLLKDPAQTSYTSPYFFATMTEARLGLLSQTDLLREIEGSRAATWALLRYISDFSAVLTTRLGQIESKTAEDKLEQLMPYLSGVCGQPMANGDFRLDLKLTHQDLASLLGIARETISREIQKLTKGGKLSYLDGYLVIPKQEANN